jgi:hypothetical protein
MKMYKISQEASELMKDAKKFDNPEDFSRAYSVRQNLIKSNIQKI